MNDKKCINCSEQKICQDSSTSWIFFIVGLIAAFAVRIVNFLIHISPLYAKIAWYVGVSGFLLFFIYKFRIIQARSRFIAQNKLVDKISAHEPLSAHDQDFIALTLCSLSSRKERINYFFIFALSAVALLLAVYMDFFK